MNYSAMFIDSIARDKRRYSDMGRHFVEVIEQSVKFNMMSDSFSSQRSEYNRLFSLPYDLMTIETYVSFEDGRGGVHTVPAAFCYEKIEDGFITYVGFMVANNWMLNPEAYKILPNADDAGNFHVSSVLLITGAKQSSDNHHIPALSARILSSLNTILDCSNVETVTVKPNIKSCWGKRKKKLNRFEYKELVIKESRVNRVSDHESEHTSACRRGHLRRGHIRNHATAGKIWVNACAVSGTGFIKKDYRITQ